MSKNVLLISVQTLKERSAVHINDNDNLIFPEIKTSQDMHIVPAIGSELFHRLQAGIVADDLSDNERLLLDDYITDALIYFVLSALPMASSFQFATKGVIRPSNEGSDLPSMDDMVQVSRYYESKARFYRERLIRYLSENGHLYSQYSSQSSDIRPIKGSYRLNCWLGDDDDC